MNPVDDRVGPEPPVSGRPHVIAIPGGPFQQRAASGHSGQAELAPMGDEGVVEVRGMDLGERVPLLHRRRVARDGETEQPGRVPDLDRLDEWPGGELAVPHGPDAVTLDFGPQRVRQSRPEDPISGRWVEARSG